MAKLKPEIPLINVSANFSSDDLEIADQLVKITGVPLRVHIRSAFRQYVAAHKKLIDEPLSFELETAA